MVVGGSGPNGLAAAIVLDPAGHRPLVLEAREVIGGGLRSAELTLPGYRHKVCAAIFALADCTPFLRRLPLARYSLRWVYSPNELTHPCSSATPKGGVDGRCGYHPARAGRWVAPASKER